MFCLNQPKRPRIDPETGSPLLYRTMPNKKGERYPRIVLPENMVAASRLYRWGRNEFVNGVVVGELHDYLFSDTPTISKKMMGNLVVNTVLYNPRKLKRAEPRSCMTYTFDSSLEFIYGLEWMICFWLPKFLAAQGEPEGDLSDELDILADTPEEEYRHLYEKPLWEFRTPEPKWHVLLAGLEERIEPTTQMSLKPKPRSLV